MNTVKGIVMEIKENYIFIATKDGQFLKTPLVGKVPSVGEEIEAIIENKKNSYRNFFGYKPLIAIAALLILAVSLSFIFINGKEKAAAYVSLDINPSVELAISSSRKVVSVTPLNSQGQILLNNSNIEGNTLDQALETIIDLSVENGYLNSFRVHTIQVTYIEQIDNFLNKETIETPIIRRLSLEENPIDFYLRVYQSSIDEREEAKNENISINTYNLRKDIENMENQNISKENQNNLRINEINWSKPPREIIEEIGFENVFTEEEFKGKRPEKEKETPPGLDKAPGLERKEHIPPGHDDEKDKQENNNKNDNIQPGNNIDKQDSVRNKNNEAFKDKKNTIKDTIETRKNQIEERLKNLDNPSLENRSPFENKEIQGPTKPSAPSQPESP